MTKTHKSQLQAAKMELERALDISRQKVKCSETHCAERKPVTLTDQIKL